MNQKNPTRNSDRWSPILAFLALAIALFSYLWAERHPEFPWDGPIMLFTAGILLLIALNRVEAKALRRKRVVRLTSTDEAKGAGEGEAIWHEIFSKWLRLHEISAWRFIAFGVSLVLTFILLRSLLTANQSSYRQEVLLWLGAIACYVLAIAPSLKPPREDWALWWEVHRRTVFLMGFITLVGFLLRLWNLGSIPSTVGGDEASQGLEAIRILAGDLRNPFTTSWLAVPTMSFFYNSITIWLFGRTIFGLRLAWVFIGTGTILSTFWLVTRLRGLTLGLITAALLATYHYHIHYSRLGSNQVADPFFISLSLLYLYRARDRKNMFDWAMAGIVVGVAQYFYAGARLTMVVLATCLVYFLWNDRNRLELLRDTFRGALSTAGAFLISAAPMIQYAIRFPDIYNARLNQVGIFQSGWVDNEMAAGGVSMWTLLWEQFQRSFFAFNAYPDRTVWYGSPNPLMDGAWAILFMLGLLYVTWRLLPPNPEPRYFPMVAWWWGGMLLGGMLTESPPSSQRLITLSVPACFFIAVILWRSLQFLQEAFTRRNMYYIGPVLVVLVLGLALDSVYWYFREFTPLNVYGSRNGEVATGMGYFLADELDANETVVFLGPPFMYLGFSTIPYLAPQAANGIDLHERLSAPPTNESLGIPPDKKPFFVSMTLRAAELDLIEQSYPGGERYMIEDSKGEPLFWVYEP
jgi:4-amino-4-deoxy-L-arabinose transferase-like glycosyltransferase